MAQKLGSLLCVDDEPGILRSLKWLLQKEFDVSTATSGHEALALVRRNDFDVIISDQRMPGMTGVEFLREASRIAPRPMRILLTGYSDLDSVTRSANESEIFRFVNKPWHIDELPRLVAEAAEIARTHPAPATTHASPEARGADSSSAVAPLERFLVIDDDPGTAETLRQVLGGRALVTRCANVAEAIENLSCHSDIGFVMSDTQVAGTDATRLLKLIKERCPDIVTIAFSRLLDANEIISLINQGQVFRFIQKPARDGYLNMIVTSALSRRNELRQRPDIVKRYSVQAMAADARDAFAGELERMAASIMPQAAAVGVAGGGGSLLQRMTSGLRLLFG